MSIAPYCPASSTTNTDNEGVLSTIPAVATTLLALAGQFLRSSLNGLLKVVGLVIAGGLCLAAGWAWNPSFPVNKILWTSSFVLVAGGWSFILLSIFYCSSTSCAKAVGLVSS